MARPKKIVRTEYVSNLPGNSPAAVNPKTGVLYINEPVFSRLPKATQDFIIEHETAHLTADTRSEIKADEVAFASYVKKGKSLKGAVNALYGQLNPHTNPEHYQRLYRQTVRAFAADRKLTYAEAEAYLRKKAGASSPAWASSGKWASSNHNFTATMKTFYTPATRAKSPVPYSPGSSFAYADSDLFLGKLINKVKDTKVGRFTQTAGKSYLGFATLGLTNNLVKTTDEKERAAQAAQAAAEAEKAAKAQQEAQAYEQQQAALLAAKAEADKKAKEEKEKKKMYWLIGGSAAGVLVIVLAVVLISRS
jgi:hypothetical protein